MSIMQGHTRRSLALGAVSLIEEWGMLAMKRGASLKDVLRLCQLLCIE